MYLRVSSDEYGTEFYGEYRDRRAARAGAHRILRSALSDGEGDVVARSFQIVTNAEKRAEEREAGY